MSLLGAGLTMLSLWVTERDANTGYAVLKGELGLTLHFPRTLPPILGPCDFVRANLESPGLASVFTACLKLIDVD